MASTTGTASTTPSGRPGSPGTSSHSTKVDPKTVLGVDEFVTQWEYIHAGFARENSPLRLNGYLDQAITLIENALDGELDPDHVEYLEKSALRLAIVAIVARSNPWSLELKPKANRFLQLAVQFILDRLESPNVQHMIHALHRIFVDSPEYCPYYTRQTKEDLPEEFIQYLPGGLGTTVGNSANEAPDTTNMTADQIDAAWKNVTNWVRFVRGERATSPLYFVNVNYFGSIGGFRRLLEMIQTTKDLPLFTLKLYVKVITVMRFSLSLAFMKVFVPVFVDAVCKRLLEWFGVNLKLDLKNHYSDTITFLISLMSEMMPEDQAMQRIDAYTMDGCLAMFNTDNLEKRLKGLRDIKALIERTQKNEERRFAAIGKFFTGAPQEDEKKKRQPRVAPKAMLSWLQKHNFLDLFFQMLKSHIEILRQGTPILIFVAQQGQLKLEHLDQIWQMADGMHEHDKRILNSSLVSLVPHLPPSHLDHLITQISEAPIDSIDEQVVDLIVSLTTLSVAADTQHKWNGLELLWKLCQDPDIPSKAGDPTSAPAQASNAGSAAAAGADSANPAPLSAATNSAASPSTGKKKKKKDNATAPIDPLLAHKAFTKLCELLTTEECAPQRPKYMERCFANLDGHRSVALSIEILRKCIDAYPARRRKKAVTDLESKTKLINVIFEDFKYYKQEAARILELAVIAQRNGVNSSDAASAASSSNTLSPSTATSTGKKGKRKNSASSEQPSDAAASSSRPNTPSASSVAPADFDVNAMIVLGRPHLQNVTQRLLFLEYIISNTAMTMRMDQVDMLWDLFITQAMSPEEREVTFGWLERASTASSGAGEVMLSEQQLQHLFTDKMLTTSGSALTSAGYKLFERYFCRINANLGKVKFAEEKNDKSIGLVSPDAIGLDKLWEIALENDDKEVSAAAIACLNQLHLNLELFMNRAKAVKIRESYVQTALDKLTHAKAPQPQQQQQPQDQASQSSAKKMSERCLKLLTECVRDFEELKGESAIPSSPNGGSSLLSGWVLGDMFGGGGKRAGAKGIMATTVKVFLKSPGKSPQRLVLNSHTTIRSIAEKAIELFNFDIYDTVKLTLEDEKDRELKEYDKTLGELKVPDDATIVVRKTQETIEGGNAEGPSAYASMLQALTLAVGGIGATTDSTRQWLTRAEAALKAQQQQLSQQGSSSGGASGAKSGSMQLEPMFPPIVRASMYREIRLGDDKTRDLHPARILCAPAHFAKLYSLLGTASDELGEPLWELLSLLPKNDATIAEIANITSEQHVQNAFPFDRPFQMLHNLQLLEHLLCQAQAQGQLAATQPNGSASPPSASAAHRSSNMPLLDGVWIQSLLGAGLLEHLIDKFFSIKVASLRKSTALMKLLPQLLRVINMLSLEVSDGSSLPSHMSSLNLSRSLTHHSQRNPNQGKYRLGKSREHFKATSGKIAKDFDGFVNALVARILQLTSALSTAPTGLTDVAQSTASLDGFMFMEDESLIIQECLFLLTPLVVSSRGALDAFFATEGFRDWLIGLILKSPSNTTRECTARAISELAAHASSLPSKSDAKSTSLTLLELLLPAQDENLDEYAKSCEEFFLTLEVLIRDVAATPCFGNKKAGDKKQRMAPSEKDGKSTGQPIAHPVLSELLKQLTAKIESRGVVEKFAVAGNEDKILIGLMQLVFSIVYRDGATTAGKKSHAPLYKPSCRSLVKELFHNCLFAIPSAERRGPDAPPKCKTKTSRNMAYKLLTELCSNCDRNLNTVLRLLQEQVQLVDMGGDYTFHPGRNEKSPTGYVGLQNQGATCYMNATMQQLFMVNEFRQGILAAHDPAFTNPLESVLKLPPEKKKKGLSSFYDDSDNSSEDEAPDWTVDTALTRLQKESVLYQLQRMFAYLQEGERKSFDTRQFCYSYKDFEGKPVNTSQQMDANEYFNRLFDSIESSLANTPQATLLKDIFGGKYANQLLGTGTECSHRRESTEPFFSISVDIKHKSTLQDSLKSFTEGEILGGDNKPECPKCGKNVDTLKRCLMHSLPPILVIHLKRFEFHYEQMRHYKLNSSCSFPNELDMEPYMRESHAAKESAKSKANSGGSDESNGQSDGEETLSDLINLAQERKAAGYYDYELAGIVVHVGSSEAGHYYSFIKERPHSLPAGRARDATVGSKWFEFNDSYVTEFDPAKIPVECFGGEDEVMEWTDLTRTSKRLVKRPRSNNAYILIYQRKTPSSSPSGIADAPKEGRHSRNPSASLQLSNISHTAASSSNGNNGDVEVASSSSPTPPPVEDVDDTAILERRSSRAVVASSSTHGDAHESVDENITVAVPKLTVNGADPKEGHDDDDIEIDGDSHKNGPTSGQSKEIDSKTIKELADDDSALPDSKDTESELPTESPTALIKPPGAVEILASIFDENRTFIIRKHLFDPEYFNFVWSIVNANLPPLPPRTADEIRRDREETQRKADVSRMFRERRELEKETNAFPSPYVPRMGMNSPNMPPPPSPKQIMVGSGANAFKIEVRAMHHTNATLKAEEARVAKERKEEEARRAKERALLDPDEQKLEQDKKMDAAEKAAKDKKAQKEAKKVAGKSPKDTSKDASTLANEGKDSKNGSKSTANSKSTNGAKESAYHSETKPKKSKKFSKTGADSSSTATDAEDTDMSSSSSSGVKADLTSFALDFIKKVYVHARETPLLNLWLTTLYRLYAANVSKAQQYLGSLIEDPMDLVPTLMMSTSEKARNCQAQMIVAAMRALAPLEKAHYVATYQQWSKAESEQARKAAFLAKPPQSYNVWFIEELWKLNRMARRQHFDAYFYILAQFAAFGREERKYLLSRGMLSEIIHFAMYFEPAAKHSRYASTPKQAATEMFWLADLLATLLMACDSEATGSDDQPPTSLNPIDPHELSKTEHPNALGYLLTSLMMREDINAHALGKILCHFSWENEEMTEFLLSNITRGISESTLPSQARGYLDALAYVIKNLDDSLQPKRFDLIIAAFPKWLQVYKAVRRAGVERVIQTFFIMTTMHPLLRTKVMQHKNSINSAIEGAGYRIL